jgi:hypothetical protein
MRPNGRTIGARTGFIAAADSGLANVRPERRSVSCVVGRDAVMMSGRAWSYYQSQPGRRRMLVLDREEGQRMQINGSVDLIIVGVERDRVKLAIARPLKSLE